MSRDDYRILAARIRAELADIERLVAKAERAAALIRQHPEEELYVDAAAHNLHDFYSAVERLLLQIARTVDRSVPSGERWHRDLLEQMRLPVSAVRPPVLSEEVSFQMEEYLRFRHVVRHVYSFRIDPQRVLSLVEAVRPLFQRLTQQLNQFTQMLEQWSSEAEHG
ncbi:MAG: hypothetical protein NZ520_02220 [bacterium]|nr:hypothetical protein [bacterium]